VDTEAISENSTDLIGKVMPSLATIRVNDRDGREQGVGAGFVVDSSGLIATCHHVLVEGRDFSVEVWPGKKLKVLGVEATDVDGDLAVLRVDPGEEPLRALQLGGPEMAPQGTAVWAFGHPLGLEHSVASGVIAAIRQIDGRDLIQLAMSIEVGNSGGPLVDSRGTVHGVVNMKSAVERNIGFAIPVAGLRNLMVHPNPIRLDRWVRWQGIDEEKWNTVFGGQWQERSGIISAKGKGSGFGGRSLCLATQTPPEFPFELMANVKLDDEGGAAGLAFEADRKDRHYGFYPSNGNLRLTHFQGPTVYSWQVLKEVPSKHYIPGDWNELKVRVERERLLCFVNGHQVIEAALSKALVPVPGRVGLVKFRETRPQFKRFQLAGVLPVAELSEGGRQLIEEFARGQGLEIASTDRKPTVIAEYLRLEEELKSRARTLRDEADRLSRLATDFVVAPVLAQLEALLEESDPNDLLLGCLWIAALDNPELDVDVYVAKVEQMATEIRSRYSETASDQTKFKELHQYLFEEQGFHGSRQEYYHPANSHLQRVIDDREGLPITLSVLYLEIARRLGLQAEGVGLPGHFVVRCLPWNGPPQTIDVFDRGKSLSESDVRSLVVQYARRLPEEEDLRPQQTKSILIRTLRNLISASQRDRDEALVRYCSALVVLEPRDPQSLLMRCVARYRTGRLAEAMQDLHRLETDFSSPFPAEELQRLKELIESAVR
jgi:regulator of sirC expression with transglutaminase-like and TPR domain